MSVYGNACLVHGRIDMFFISCTSSLCLFFLLVFFCGLFFDRVLPTQFSLYYFNAHHWDIELCCAKSFCCVFFSLFKHSVFCRFLSYKCSVASLDNCCSWWAYVMIRFSFILLNYYNIYFYTFIVSQVQKKWKKINKFVFICLFWLFLEIVRNTFSTFV